MKITFIVAADNMSGGNRVTAIYAEQLQRLGHDVKVIVPPPRVVTKRERALIGLRSLKRGDSRGAIAQFRQIVRAAPRVPGFMERSSCEVTALESHRPVREPDVPDADVVVATWWETAHWVASLSERKGAKAYFMQDYGAPGQELEKIIPTWRLGFHIVTIARWLENLVRTHAPEARVEVVGNAVDLDLFRQPPRSMPTRPTVGFVYREAWVKGYDTVLEAYRLARREVPPLRLVTFGSRPRDQLSHLPVDVEYRASVPDSELAGLYGACTAWLFASRLEGYGLPISEAMACRTPVIATRAGAAPELIERGGGWLVPVDDPQAMSKAIVEACSLSPEDWSQASHAAYESVTSYTWSDAGEAFAAALDKARSNQRPRTS